MDKDALFVIFKQAISSEHEAYEFYSKAAQNATNNEAKRLFEKFAAVELTHKNELEDLYKALR